VKEVEDAWPLHWLIDEGVISWVEGHTLMNILDVDRQAHVHQATKAATYRAEKKANQKR
jgi:hypothetical protein